MFENTQKLDGIYQSNIRDFHIEVKTELPLELLRYGYYECFPQNHRIKFIVMLRHYNPKFSLHMLNQISKQIWEEFQQQSLIETNVSKDIPL